MLYVPDALGYTIEVIEGSGHGPHGAEFSGAGRETCCATGSRAMASSDRGPYAVFHLVVPCRPEIVDVDDACSVPVLAVLSNVSSSVPVIFCPTFCFIAVSRLLLSLIPVRHTPEGVILSYSWILYLNQLINASVKVYCIYQTVEAALVEPRQPDRRLRGRQPQGSRAQRNGQLVHRNRRDDPLSCHPVCIRSWCAPVLYCNRQPLWPLSPVAYSNRHLRKLQSQSQMASFILIRLKNNIIITES